MELTTDYQKIATGEAQTFNVATGYLELWAKYNSIDEDNEKANYSVQLRLVVSGGYIGNYQSAPYNTSADGIGKITGDNGSGNYRSQTLQTITGDVSYTDDGIKTVNISGQINFTAWGQTLTVSGNADLPPIDIGILRLGKSNEYKKAIAYIGINGVWKKCKVYIGKNNEWKKGK